MDIHSIIFSGAKNSAIARTLDEYGYAYAVFGHDCVEAGVYQCELVDGGWNQGAAYHGSTASLSHVDEEMGAFWGYQKVTSADIPALKKLYSK